MPCYEWHSFSRLRSAYWITARRSRQTRCRPYIPSRGTVSFSHDVDGEMTAASNTAAGSSVAAYTYQHDSAGDVTAVNASLAACRPTWS